MTERSMLWDGATLGDCGPYSNDELMDIFFRAILNGTDNRGVLKGWLNGLEVTGVGAASVSVASGGAIVYGLFYESDGVVTVGPVVDGDLIVITRDWGWQEARLANVPGLVQDPGVTYDLPLAQVTVAGGLITVITDMREYCRFSAQLKDGAVMAGALQTDAVTTAKLENQTRWLTWGTGALKADSSTPAIFYASGGTGFYSPFSMFWGLSETVQRGLWLTTRIPVDFTGASVTIYAWNTSNDWALLDVVTGNVRWGWAAWTGQPGAAFASQSGGTTVANDGRTRDHMYRDTIATVNVAAGDLLHLNVYRDGVNGLDSCNVPTRLFMVELSYVADS